MSGLMSITGEPGRGPMRVGIAVADLAAGLFAALGILVALCERERSGEGQWVKTSLLEALLFMLDFQGARYIMKGEVPRQVGNNHPTGVADRHLPDQRRLYQHRADAADVAPLLHALGAPDWIDHPDYATAGRAAQEPRSGSTAMIDEITVRGDGRRADRETQRGRHSLRADLRHRPGLQRPAGEASRHRAAGGVEDCWALITLVGQPVTLSRTQSRLATAAPEYGEHNDEVLRELGYAAAEIEGFRTAGAV